MLHLTTREVVLDAIARDKNHNPVGDLAESEFQVFDVGKHADKNPKHILSMRVIDPHSSDPSRSVGRESGFSIRSGATCALSATPHYELAIQASPEPGFHQILIRTTRAQVTLSFRHRYYVGPTPSESGSKERKGPAETIALGDAACFHTITPSTLDITAHPIVVAGGRSTRYGVVVRPESLASIGLNGTNTQVHLDFGMCTFDASGNLAQYYHTTSDRQLTPSELETAQVRGFESQLEIPGDTPYLVRLVVREHETGNLGIVDVSRPVSLTGQGDSVKFRPPPVGTIRAFGVVTPLPNAFCGDVYEISYGAAVLPDFWNLDPIGSIYANALNVVDQDASDAIGIPGVTRAVQWFGVDYYGEFFITKPGEYKFDLESDDGARLEIDNQVLINDDEIHAAKSMTAKVKLTAGRHTIHVPYFQGSPPNVALILTIKPPGESTRPFNLSEFAPPQTTP
ncbi:MAG: PA14 domain-containing protein [Terracidiphilus sp.]